MYIIGVIGVALTGIFLVAGPILLDVSLALLRLEMREE